MTYEDNGDTRPVDESTQRYIESVTPTTPRLFVKMRMTPSGENFEWGIVGNIPPLSLLAALRRVINDMPDLDENILRLTGQACPDEMIVIVYDSENKDFDWYTHPVCVCYAMMGMLEMIMSMLTDANKVRQAVAQNMVVGIDGKPFRG